MPQDKNHLTASTQSKNGSLYAVIQYKDETGKWKNKWKSLGLKEGASKAKINIGLSRTFAKFGKFRIGAGLRITKKNIFWMSIIVMFVSLF